MVLHRHVGREKRPPQGVRVGLESRDELIIRGLANAPLSVAAGS